MGPIVIVQFHFFIDQNEKRRKKNEERKKKKEQRKKKKKNCVYVYIYLIIDNLKIEMFFVYVNAWDSYICGR